MKKNIIKIVSNKEYKMLQKKYINFEGCHICGFLKDGDSIIIGNGSFNGKTGKLYEDTPILFIITRWSLRLWLDELDKRKDVGPSKFIQDSNQTKSSDIDKHIIYPNPLYTPSVGTRYIDDSIIIKYIEHKDYFEIYTQDDEKNIRVHRFSKKLLKN